jgi:hypothetical protein
VGGLMLTFCTNSTRGRGGRDLVLACCIRNFLLSWANTKEDFFDCKKDSMKDWERRLLLSWAKTGKDSKGRNKATRSEGDDLGDSFLIDGGLYSVTALRETWARRRCILSTRIYRKQASTTSKARCTCRSLVRAEALGEVVSLIAIRVQAASS